MLACTKGTLKEGRGEEVIKMTIVQKEKEKKTGEGIYEMGGQNEATKGSAELIVFRWCNKIMSTCQSV